MVDFNINPFFDDFSDDKQFFRILFRPGIAIQARELTQMQSILQNQIKRFGSHIFEDGAVVTGAKVAIDTDIVFVKLEDQFSGVPINVAQFLNKNITGGTSGATAKVVHVEALDNTDPNVLFVRYTSGDTPSTASSFTDGENIAIDITGVQATLIAASATGNGSIVGIDEGVVFVDGIFTFVNKQTLVLEKFNNTPSYRVGLLVTDSIVTENQDSSLNDPAQGSPNFAAPGAHRFKIDMVFTKKALNLPDEIDNAATQKFVELFRIENGIKIKQNDYNIYADLEDNLARRTFEESGHYTVEPFQIRIDDHPTDTAKLNVGLEPGRAFIKGYEFRTVGTDFVEIDKGRDTQTVNNFDINAQYGNFCVVDTMSGIFDSTGLIEIDLLNVNIASIADQIQYDAAKIGTATLRHLEFNSGVGPFVYNMYLYNLNFTTGSFKDVLSLWKTDFVTGINANIETTLGQDLSGNSLLFGSANNSMLFSTPNSTVKTLKPLGVTDTDYITQRIFTSVSFSSGTASINETGTNTFFGAAGSLSDTVKRSNYHIVITAITNAGTTGLVVGDIVDFDSPRDITLSGSNQTATLNINDGAFIGTADIIASVNLNTKGEKTKVKVQTTKLGVVLSGGVASLLKSDVFNIVSILDTGNANLDVTNSFTFDSGQKDNFYDHGSIILVPGQSVVGPFDVTFDYFTHSGSGYFSVDSYTGQVNYEDIPIYVSSVTGEQIPLTDILDYRPRRTDDVGTIQFDIPSTGIDIPLPNTNVNADYVFYLARIDKIILRSNRTFGLIRGVSSINPVLPSDDIDSMTLYTLRIPAFTFTKKDIDIEYIDNRRFTMRDIGGLEKRIKNLEYYTSLSLLEKDAKETKILDNLGNDRFKNGIIVDAFNGHSIGDVVNPDYLCSIDFDEQELRSPFTPDNNSLTFDVASSQNITKTGDLITADYIETSFISQPLASKSMSVNPFNVTNWFGQVLLTPSGDNWIDTQNNPDVVVNLEGENDAWTAIGQLLTDNRTSGFGTQWNDWQTTWTGNQTLRSRSIRRRRIGPIIQTHIPNVGAVARFRTTARETFDVDVRQTRTGVRTSFAPETIQRNIGERITDVSIVPFIRARTISFSAENLKPNTEVFPFFDGVDVKTFVAPTAGVNGDQLFTDSSGKIAGTFDIPNTDSLRFRTGERIFRLIDNTANDVEAATTNAEIVYQARGLLQTREETIISTRVPVIRREDLTSTRVIRDVVSQERLLGEQVRSLGFDPVAQTFFVDANVFPEGIFLSSLELFFKNKDANIPVTIQIRPTINGFPHSSAIFPFSTVVKKPNEVNVSADASIATKFTFDSPVYLQPGEYSFIALSNSNEYEVFVAEIGSNQLNTEKRITEQPYIGSLFKSQNATTWSPEQLEDITFKLNRCKFETAGPFEAIFNNTLPSVDVLLDTMYLMVDTIEFKDDDIVNYFKATNDSTGIKDTNWNRFIPNENLNFDARQRIDNVTTNTFSYRAVMTLTSDHISPIIDVERLSVIAIANNINNDSTNETDSSGGSATAKYITKRVTLNEGFDADSLRVLLALNKPSGSDIKVYYKVLSPEDETPFDDRGYIQMTQDTASTIFSIGDGDFREFEFSADNITYSGFTTFQTFAIKIVMLSTNTSKVPRIRDLRVIAVT